MVLKSWVPRLEQNGIKMLIGGSDGDAEKGVKPRGSEKLKLKVQIMPCL